MLLEKHYTDLKDLIHTNPSIGMFNDEVFTSLKLGLQIWRLLTSNFLIKAGFRANF